ncbi:MAG: serine hydrolase domain-containing protein [Balneola sp.]
MFLKTTKILLAVLIWVCLSTNKIHRVFGQSFSEIADSSIPNLMEQHNIPGLSIAVFENGNLSFKRGYGFADVENNIPVYEKTGFNIGSISKTFTAWGVMKLVESGKIDPDKPVESYLTRWKIPDSEFDKSKVTVRNVLSHTSGLSVHGYPGFHPDIKLPTLEESLNGENGPLRDNAPVKLIYEPNTKFKYSGGGFTILQLLIEEVTDQSFAEYMKESVFDPLDMMHTSFSLTPQILEKSAIPYNEEGNEIYLERFTAQAAAGLHTTLDDFIKFVQANLNKNSVLNEKTISNMLKPVPASKNMYGLGYRVLKMGPVSVKGHPGSNDGWETAFFLHQESSSAIIMLTNSSNGKDALISILREWVRWKLSRGE